jgi:hypothetical protein
LHRRRVKRANHPVQFSLGEGVDIGMDAGSPIDFTYKLPFPSRGRSKR